MSNDEDCITNINEIPEVNDNNSSSVNIEENNQEYDNNMSEENAHTEDNGDNIEGIITELENEKDTSIVVEDNNNNFVENNDLEATGIDDIVVGNITTDNDNIAVEEIEDITKKNKN